MIYNIFSTIGSPKSKQKFIRIVLLAIYFVVLVIQMNADKECRSRCWIDITITYFSFLSWHGHAMSIMCNKITLQKTITISFVPFHLKIANCNSVCQLVLVKCTLKSAPGLLTVHKNNHIRHTSYHYTMIKLIMRLVSFFLS